MSHCFIKRIILSADVRDEMTGAWRAAEPTQWARPAQPTQLSSLNVTDSLIWGDTLEKASVITCGRGPLTGQKKDSSSTVSHSLWLEVYLLQDHLPMLPGYTPGPGRRGVQLGCRWGTARWDMQEGRAGTRYWEGPRGSSRIWSKPLARSRKIHVVPATLEGKVKDTFKYQHHLLNLVLENVTSSPCRFISSLGGFHLSILCVWKKSKNRNKIKVSL